MPSLMLSPNCPEHLHASPWKTSFIQSLHSLIYSLYLWLLAICQACTRPWGGPSALNPHFFLLPTSSGLSLFSLWEQSILPFIAPNHNPASPASSLKPVMWLLLLHLWPCSRQFCKCKSPPILAQKGERGQIWSKRARTCILASVSELKAPPDWWPHAVLNRDLFVCNLTPDNRMWRNLPSCKAGQGWRAVIAVIHTPFLKGNVAGSVFYFKEI